MKVYGTPPSHFTRKVRVLLQELGQPYEFVQFEVKQLMAVGAEKFADNPLHLFPVLVDGDQRLFDSDAICEYVIDQYGKGKEISSFFPVTENRVHDRQRMVMINGGMSAGVSVIRARRSGVEDWKKHPWLCQEMEAISGAAAWLEKDLGGRESYYPGRLTMMDITLQCFLEWAEFREMITDWSKLPGLVAFKARWASRPSFAGTHPSLTEVSR